MMHIQIGHLLSVFSSCYCRGSEFKYLRKREISLSNVRPKGRGSLLVFLALPFFLATHTCKIRNSSLQNVYLSCGDTETLGIIQCKREWVNVVMTNSSWISKIRVALLHSYNTFNIFPISSGLLSNGYSQSLVLSTRRLGSESHSAVYVYTELPSKYKCHLIVLAGYGVGWFGVCWFCLFVFFQVCNLLRHWEYSREEGRLTLLRESLHMCLPRNLT